MSAEDRDGLPEHNAFVYAFDGGSTTTNEFSIDPQTGLIVTRRPLDREVGAICWIKFYLIRLCIIYYLFYLKNAFAVCLLI